MYKMKLKKQICKLRLRSALSEKLNSNRRNRRTDRQVSGSSLTTSFQIEQVNGKTRLRGSCAGISRQFRLREICQDIYHRPRFNQSRAPVSSDETG